MGLFIHLKYLLREREMDLLFHLFMYSLAISCMCPNGIEPVALVYWDNPLTN